LRLERIAFSGTKIIQDVATPFVFEWSPNADGIWGIASEDNSAGKSSLVQIAFWAMRGSPKHLTKTVREWLSTVSATFQAGADRVDVNFEVERSVPRGDVTVTSATAKRVLGFTDERAFVAAMDEVVRTSLGMSRLPATQTIDEEIHEYEDGWVALSIGLVSDTHSDAIIGETIPGTPFTGRLLQMFVGLPWVLPQLQVRARLKKLESDASQRARKIAKLGARSVASLEADVADIVRRIEDEGVRNSRAHEVLAAQARYAKANENAKALLDRVEDRRHLVGSAKEIRAHADRALLALQQEHTASAFLHRLKPVCCPRCSSPIGDERLEREVIANRCSVCDTSVADVDPNAAAGEIDAAERRASELRDLERDAQAALAGVERELIDAQRERDWADIALQQVAALGNTGDLRRLEQQRERLEGMLEVSRLMEGAETVDAQVATILKAAHEEATVRVTGASDEIMGRASQEISTIARRLGIRDLKTVTLNRAAHVSVDKGGSVSSWRDLTDGEQLRLRIATVVALVRTAREFGIGRHPGLLFIDSPGREEMKDQNLDDVLGELARIAEETPNLQLFVAMRRVDVALRAIPTERMLTAGADQFLW
jgi:hypothetical protein